MAFCTVKMGISNSITYPHFFYDYLQSLPFSKQLHKHSPQLSIPHLQILNILLIQIPGSIDPPCDLVQVIGAGTQQHSQFLNVRHIHPDNIPVHRHFPQIRPLVVGSQLFHFPVNHRLFLRRHLEI